MYSDKKIEPKEYDPCHLTATLYYAFELMNWRVICTPRRPLSITIDSNMLLTD